MDSDREEGEGPGDMLQAWLGELDTLKKVSRALSEHLVGSVGLQKRLGSPKGSQHESRKISRLSRGVSRL